MANNFQIVISAVNQASGPIGQVQQAVRRLGSQVNGSKISNFGNTLTAAFKSPASATSSIARFLTGTNLAGGAVAALTFKIMEMESQWASSVRSMNNLGIRTGLPTRQAYGVQFAGRLAGLTAEQANGGIEQVRQTYSDALNNLNPDALKRYQAAGISTNPARMESIESVLTKLAAYAETLRQQGKYGGAQNFLGAAGAGQLVDFLGRGPKQVAADFDAAKSFVPTDDEIRRAREYANETAKLSITYDNLRNTLGGDIEPGLEKLLKGTQALVDLISGRSSPQTREVRRGFEQFGNALRGNGNLTMAELQQNGAVPGSVGALDPMERFGNWLRGNGARSNSEVAQVPNANVPRAIAYFEAHGSTHEQAIGKTANLLRESSLDPVKEGDNGQAYGIAQWHKDRQADYQKWAGVPIQYSSLEDQLGFVDHELRNKEQAAGSALNRTRTAREAAEIFSRQFERPNDADGEAAARGQIADQLASIYAPSVAGAASQGAAGRDERIKVEIVHRNPPPGTNVNVSGSSGVDATLTTDRQQSSLGEQYAYSPGAF